MKNKVAVATYRGVEKLMLKGKFTPPPLPAASVFFILERVFATRFLAFFHR